MEKYNFLLNCTLPVNPKSFIALANKLEISIPCVNCHRQRRTIIFEDINKNGICTPRKKCNGFKGKLSKREIIKKPNSIELNYTINFNYAPFLDEKYGIESNLDSKWARIYFTLKCTVCQKENTISTQENIVRPRNVKCTCGNVILKENHPPFKYSITLIDL